MLSRAMLNWAIVFLIVGLLAGVIAFADASSGVWTFVLLSAFVVLMAVGAVPFLARPGNGRGRMT